MKNVLYFLFLSLFSPILFAQQLDDIAKETSYGWYKIKPEVLLKTDLFLENAGDLMELDSDNGFITIREDQDDLGFTHFRLQQQYKGINIEAADFLVHSHSGNVRSMNGKLVKDINLSTKAGLSKKTVVKKALNYVNAQKYMWEDPASENMLKEIRHNPSATYYPNPELVIAQEKFNQVGADYRLMYKVDIYATEPLSRQDIYIDANTGEVVFTLDRIHTGDVPGVAHTKYTGVQNIITDSIGPDQYRLRESTTGGGIETYNMQESRDYSTAVDFTDSNNIWNNVNAFQDEVATDAHWGAQETYNYFLEKHNRDSYDNKGTKLLNYVHYDQNYVNAFWDGSRMTYGDGNGNTFTPLISLDIAAHEMAHGVTQFSAALIYMDEYGALNESFSDIFAATVEYYGDSSNFDYRVGEDITSDGLGLRSMEDPGTMGDPDTYLAGLWYTGQLDNGGVHINSGVQNYWFYIMVEGDSGTNDLGIPYNIQGLGMDKAEQIAYRNLAYYLTRTSEYIDARAGAMQAAEDIFGVCSYEMLTTVDAWYAVGVGKPMQDEDFVLVDVLSPETSCGLGSNEAVTVLVRYYDCNDTLSAGDTLNLAYSLDGQTAVSEMLVLPNNMVAGDTLIYTFAQTIDLSSFTSYDLKTWINYGADLDPDNDTIQSVSIENSLQQNSDFEIVDITSPQSDCDIPSSQTVDITVRFLGCDSLVAGQDLDVYYQLDNQTFVSERITLNTTLYPEDEIDHSFSGTIDLSARGQYNLNAWVQYSSDPESANDSILNRAIQNPYKIQDHLFTFEDPTNTLDSMYISVTANSKVDFYSDAAVDGTLGIRFTGSDAISTLPEFPLFSRTDPWDVYPEFSSFACACVDARDWDSVKVSFDLKQTYSKVWRVITGRNNVRVSSLRLLVDGNQIGDNYNPITNDKDLFRLKEITLKDYAHTQFELCFEARNYLAEEFDLLANSEGDNAYIDNLRIYNDGNISLREGITPLNQMKIYPNPSSALFTLELKLNERLDSKYQLYSSTGKLLQTRSLNLETGNHQLELDLSNYPNGMYVLQIEGDSHKLWLAN